MFVDSLTEEENPQPDCDPVWINQGGAAVFLCVKKVIKFSLFFLSIHTISLSPFPSFTRLFCIFLVSNRLLSIIHPLIPSLTTASCMI